MGDIFSAISHDTTGSAIWYLLLALALRGVYANYKKKDYFFALAFLAVLLFSIFMVGVGLGFFITDF